MTEKTILKFGAVKNGEAGDLAGWIVVDGNPTMKTAVQHTTEDGKVMSGTWQATPGTYHATYSDYEFVHMISGRIVITPDGGAPVEVGPGDAFVVEADFKGTWKIIEPVTSISSSGSAEAGGEPGNPVMARHAAAKPVDPGCVDPRGLSGAASGTVE
ncbi:cupin domain-containing protein [Mesorhizobium sp. M6A.T.Cr.TU.017.01.1.1]|nr:cupin domain-containing protein [Mesorhizobium sp. M6A.T.Cr.TU.017.01.1.1]